MEKSNPKAIVARYLEDAIAAENSFESQLRAFAKEGDNEAVKAMFEQHADETRRQHEMLTARLKDLGESPSGFKSMLAHMFGMAPKSASLGHEEEERTVQNLMIAFAVENSEIGMYECLATVAAAAGDSTTESLARRIQQQEKDTADKVWRYLAPCARDAFERLTMAGVSR
jgi:ferritin-like metal-binding protein YciE